MECKKLMNKEVLTEKADVITKKAKGVWKSLTENEMEIKLNLTVTPLGIIAAAAGVGATICAVRALHKMEIKRALNKQAKQFEAAAAAKAEAVETVAEASEETVTEA